LAVAEKTRDIISKNYNEKHRNWLIVTYFILNLLRYKRHQHLCTCVHIVCLFVSFAVFYLLFQLHIICYPALGPQGCY